MLNRKRLYPSKSVKYLGIKIDENLNWKQHIHDIITIYFSIFDTHINYANLTCGQNLHAVSRIVILQKKALRIMNFQSRDSHSSLLFKSNHILKLEDKILIENTLFINKSFNNLLPPVFKSWFTFCSEIHNYQTISSTADKIFKPSYRTDSYGKNSITIGAINSWNKTQHQFSNLSLKTYSPTKIKSLLFKICIGKY